MASANPVQKNDLRRYSRYDASGTLRFLWEDGQGGERVSSGRLVNVSVEGIQLLVDEKIPIRACVLCNDAALGIRGRGSVRYCHYRKGKYQVGIEFSGGTGWREPADEPVE